LSTANFGNGEVSGDWFVLHRLADGSHVSAQALNNSDEPARVRQVRVGTSGVSASVGAFDTDPWDALYDPTELRITSYGGGDLSGWTQAFSDDVGSDFAALESALAVGPDGAVFYSSDIAVPYDGATEAYTAVFTAEGSLAWDSSETPGSGVFLGSGNLLIAGVLDGERDFGGGRISGASYFVEFDASGNHVASWAFDVTFSATGSSSHIPRPRLRATPQYAVIEGRVWQIEIPDSLGSHDLSLPTSMGWLAAAMSGPDTYSFAEVWPTVTSDSGEALTPNLHVTVDAQGRTFVCGFYWRQLAAFGQSFTAVGTEDSDADIVIAALDPDGALLFAGSFGDVGLDTCSDLAIDAEGGLLVTGRYQTSLDFGNGLLEPEPRTADDPPMMYIARFELVGGAP
jgi:hypothetical protein